MAKNNNEHRKGKMSVEEAGRRGGEKTAAEHGPEFYEEIGSRGGSSSGGNNQGKNNNPGNFANRDKEDVRRAGHEGGSHNGGRGNQDR